MKEATEVNPEGTGHRVPIISLLVIHGRDLAVIDTEGLGLASVQGEQDVRAVNQLDLRDILVLVGVLPLPNQGNLPVNRDTANHVLNPDRYDLSPRR